MKKENETAVEGWIIFICKPWHCESSKAYVLTAMTQSLVSRYMRTRLPNDTSHHP